LKGIPVVVVLVAVELDHDARVVVVEVDSAQPWDLHLAPRLGKSEAPTQGEKCVLENAVRGPVTRQSQCQSRPEPGSARSAGATRLLQAPYEPGQGTEATAQDVVQTAFETGRRQALGEVQHCQIDRGDLKFALGDDVTRLQQGSPVQPDAPVSGPKLPRGGHLNLFGSRKIQTVQICGGEVRKDRPSLNPQVRSDQILRPARR